MKEIVSGTVAITTPLICVVEYQKALNGPMLCSDITERNKLLLYKYHILYWE